MVSVLDKQTNRFLRSFSRLARAYQFRDRNEICCRGISVSQCYTLELLDSEGEMTMGDLAAQMYLDVSTMTRVVEQLSKNDLVVRQADPDDRRVVLVKITGEGRKVYAGMRKGLLAEYRQILENVPAASRPALLKAIDQLLQAFLERSDQQVALTRASRRSR